MALVAGGDVDEAEDDERVVPKLFNLMLDSARCASFFNCHPSPHSIKRKMRRHSPFVIPKLITATSKRRPVSSPSPTGRRPLFHFPKNPTVSSFHSVWVQGVVVVVLPGSTGGNDQRLVLDDGTGPPVVLVLDDSCAMHSFRQREFLSNTFTVGAYIACIGEVTLARSIPGEDGDGDGEGNADKNNSRTTPARYALRARRIHDLSEETNREAMWNVEVVEAFRVLELAGFEGFG